MRVEKFCCGNELKCSQYSLLSLTLSFALFAHPVQQITPKYESSYGGHSSSTTGLLTFRLTIDMLRTSGVWCEAIKQCKL